MSLISTQDVNLFELDGIAYDQTFGGSAGSTYNFQGNGHQTTRHLGFSDSSVSVRHVLVAVGDDDTPYHDGSDSMGNREFLSSFGYTASATPEPSTALLASIVILLGFTRRRRT